MAKTTREIVMELILKDEQFRKEVQKASGQVKKVGDATEKTTKKSVGLFKKLRLGWIAVAAAVTAAIRGIVRFTKAAVKASAENESAQLKFQKVFRGSIKVATDYRKELTKSFAMSGTAATMMLSRVQDLLVPMGLARDSAAELSGTVIKLATDIGVFNGQPTERVIEAIQSAMVGMNRPMMQYGVVLTAATVKQEAMNMRLHDGTGELTAAAKAQATLSLVAKGSADAVGATERQYSTFAVLMKRVKAAVEDIVNVVGDKLVGAFRPAVAVLVDFLKRESTIRAISGTFQFLADVLKGFGFVIGTVAKGFRNILTMLGLIEKDIRKVGEAAEEETVRMSRIQRVARLAELKKSYAELTAEQNVHTDRWAAFITGSEEEQADIMRRFRLKNIDEAIAFAEKERDIGRKKADERRKITAEIQTLEAEFAEELRAIQAARAEEEERRREEEEAKRLAALAIRRAQEEDDHQQRLADAERHWGDVEAANELRRMSEVAAERDKNQKIFRQAVKFGNQGLNLARTLAKQESDARIRQIQRRVDAGVISETQGAQEIRKEKRAAFTREKKAAASEALIRGALAIMNISAAWAAAPPVAVALSLIAAALTAAQIGAIQSQPQPYAAGGIAGAHGPELAMLGERGPELVVPNHLLAAAAAGGGDTTNALNLGPESVVINISGPMAVTEEGIKDAVYAGMRQTSDDFGQGNQFRG